MELALFKALQNVALCASRRPSEPKGDEAGGQDEAVDDAEAADCAEVEVIEPAKGSERAHLDVLLILAHCSAFSVMDRKGYVNLLFSLRLLIDTLQNFELQHILVSLTHNFHIFMGNRT